MSENPSKERAAVRAHWAAEPCGTRGIGVIDCHEGFERIELERYALEPYIPVFAQFCSGRGKNVLEVGIGVGTDFVNWVRNGAKAWGVDLTREAVSLTAKRLQLESLSAHVLQADAENLPFPSNYFDIVYSYGALHHSPDTARAVTEVYRVLKTDGEARIMVYHLGGVVCWLVWIIHCLLGLHPWRSRRWAVSQYLESPGTKAYSVREARALFADFAAVAVRTQLSQGDLVLMRPSEKYRKWYHKLAYLLYPRWAIRLIGDRFGTDLLIRAIK